MARRPAQGCRRPSSGFISARHARVRHPSVVRTRRPRGGTVIHGIIRGDPAANDNGHQHPLGTPHPDLGQREAEIRVGDNIPIISSRVDGVRGRASGGRPLELGQRRAPGHRRHPARHPQITEGDTLRLEIFQEITAVNAGLTDRPVGAAEDVGVALSNRRIENTVVVVKDGDTVVIGGLISDDYQDTVVTKVPWLGDIPVLGWAFKSTSTSITKHQPARLPDAQHRAHRRGPGAQDHPQARGVPRRQAESARSTSSEEQLEDGGATPEAKAEGRRGLPSPSYGAGPQPGGHPASPTAARYPLESRMGEIEQLQAEAGRTARSRRRRSQRQPDYFLQAGDLRRRGLRAVDC